MHAGRGSLAGSVCVCACTVAADAALVEGVRDSKKVTSEKERTRLAHQLRETPGVLFAIAFVDQEEIDAINISQATLKAMTMAVKDLVAKLPADSHDKPFVLIDGNVIPHGIKDSHRDRCVRCAHMLAHNVCGRCEAIEQGDGKVYCIAAASIIAKDARDRVMRDLHVQYPGFDLDKNKGYPSAAHRRALAEKGPSTIHRLSFATCRNARKKQHLASYPPLPLLPKLEPHDDEVRVKSEFEEPAAKKESRSHALVIEALQKLPDQTDVPAAMELVRSCPCSAADDIGRCLQNIGTAMQHLVHAQVHGRDTVPITQMLSVLNRLVT